MGCKPSQAFEPCAARHHELGGTMRDARRRNRNIGTAKSGHGQDNRMVVPEPWADARRYWERLRNPVVVQRVVGGRNLPFVVEAPRPPFLHPCTIDDLAELIALLPSSDFSGIAFVALRQPTRKQTLLSLVWGRLIYHAEVAGFSGPALILEAQRSPGTVRWPKSLQPWVAAELELLRSDGHQVSTEARSHRVISSPDAMRATQLFRTVPHEVGHYVDYRQRVIEPSSSEAEFNRNLDLFWSRPPREREEFADRYGFAFRTQQGSRLPFPQRFNQSSIKRDGLEPSWFQPPRAAA
jgi:hypothetical protein